MSSAGYSTGSRVIIGVLAVLGAFFLLSSIFWSIWIFFRWILGPLLVVGLIVYFVARRRDSKRYK
jgi:hypothetical protein